MQLLNRNHWRLLCQEEMEPALPDRERELAGATAIVLKVKDKAGVDVAVTARGDIQAAVGVKTEILTRKPQDQIRQRHPFRLALDRLKQQQASNACRKSAPGNDACEDNGAGT